jgi:hypothetical protein
MSYEVLVVAKVPVLASGEVLLGGGSVESPP